MLDRRDFLQLGAIGAASFAVPRMAFAAPGMGAKRLLFIIQRGAADGLSAVVPVGDPGYSALRGAGFAGDMGGMKLDSMFSLHPSLTEAGRLFAGRQALFFHAVASPYRDRSHFDGQNVLETGGSSAYQLKDGWMNRLISLLPADHAVALSPTVPMALRGARPVESYAPSKLPDAPDDLLLRISDLYAADPQLAPLWHEAQAARMLAGGSDIAKGASLGDLAARMMRGPSGARLAMIETDGWDTHVGQNQRLGKQLAALDKMIATFRTGMGADWDNSIVLVATEFGRTAAINGTAGTDHGTGSVAMLFGGGVKGGRVVADWPGLGQSQLYQSRDLKPTLDLDSLILTALSQNFAIDPARLSPVLFPETRPQAMRQALVA